MNDSDREFFDALGVVMTYLFTPLVDSIVDKVRGIIVDMENQKNDD